MIRYRNCHQHPQFKSTSTSRSSRLTLKIQKPESGCQTRVEEGRRSDREKIDVAILSAEVRKINQTLLEVIAAVHPIRTEIKTLQTELDKLKKKVNGHDSRRQY